MDSKTALALCGKNLQQLRLKKGLSAEALAVLAGVNAEDISRFEEGDGGGILLADLLRLAETLDADIRNILGGIRFSQDQ